MQAYNWVNTIYFVMVNIFIKELKKDSLIASAYTRRIYKTKTTNLFCELIY